MGSTRLSYARTQYPMGNGKPMPNVRQQERARRPGRGSALALAVSVWTAAVEAADCPRQARLGTSRVMAIDPAVWPRIGRRDFAQTRPRADHEVALTFDDGPWPATTPRVLRTLAKECVRATFFLIGKAASEWPSMVQAEATEGHSIGSHTWMHLSLRRMPYADAVDAVLPLSRFRIDARHPRSPAVARHQRVLD